ncbi:MAG TPA: hypothetical protein VLK33_09565 [Terriglobales bacterium]|nr:hypothetical protein [Terriglobales bacterium]
MKTVLKIFLGLLLFVQAFTEMSAAQTHSPDRLWHDHGVHQKPIPKSMGKGGHYRPKVAQTWCQAIMTSQVKPQFCCVYGASVPPDED